MIYDGVARGVYAAFCPVPFTSLLMDDCLVKGRDFHDGGAHYNQPAVCGVGTGTVTDSLAAIKKLVFEQKKLTLQALVNALRNDFSNNEKLRQILRTRAKVGQWR
jgi:trans-4-hydroxy-L-proline dehydratase